MQYIIDNENLTGEKDSLEKKVDELENQILLVEKALRINHSSDWWKKQKKSLKVINVYSFPTEVKKEKCGTITKTVLFTDLEGTVKVISTVEKEKNKYTYIIDPKNVKKFKFVISPSDVSDPLKIQDLYLGKSRKKEISRTVFDLDDPDLCILPYPDLVNHSGNGMERKNFGVVEFDQYNKLRSQIIGKKRKREDQKDGDRCFKKKQKV